MDSKQKAAEYQTFYRNYLLDNVIPFWINSDLLDRENGGYITSVDRQGKSYNDDKSVWFQGRGLWTFSALCNRYGKCDEWLDAARIGKAFLEDHCVDTDGRMFFQVTREGKPLRKRRYMFSESFYVVGLAEYALATNDKDALQ
jgi:N-acylglucosamine 2-epimerase